MKPAIAILLVLVAACTRDRAADRDRSDPAQHISAASDSKRVDTPAVIEPPRPLDGSFVIRGIDNGKPYRIDIRNELLILHRDATPIDTFVTASIDHYTPTVGTYDSTFLAFQAVSRGSPTTGYTELFCISADTLRLSGTFTSYSGIYGVYELVLRQRDRPFALFCSEQFALPDGKGEHDQIVRRTTRLRFDTTHLIFWSDSVRLDAVLTEDSSRAFSGTYPGIALAESTTVYVEGRWYCLWPDHNSTHESARPPQRRGSGSRGDFLVDCSGD
jgi:hypothetical protein